MTSRLTKKQKAVTKVRDAAARCTVAFQGGFCEVSVPFALSIETVEAALYGDVRLPDGSEMPPAPTSDGAYLLIGNVWVPE